MCRIFLVLYNKRSIIQIFGSIFILIKKFAINRPYPLPTNSLSKNYNNQIGFIFTMNDIDSFYQEKQNIKKYLHSIEHNSTNVILCKKLVQNYPCTRCRLTVREATCKENPIQRKSFEIIFCPYPNCVKLYKYKKHYIVIWKEIILYVIMK